MMQIPSSNSSVRSSPSSAKAAVTRWFDGIFDKACCAVVPGGYNVGDEVDDSSVAYDSYDSDDYDYENRPQTSYSRQQQRRRRDLSSRQSTATVSCPRNSERRRHDDPSILWDAAEDSIQWLVDTKQSAYQVLDFEEARRLSHKNTKLSPASDATATTVMSGSTSCSQTTAPRGSSGRAAKPPPIPSRIGKKPMIAKDRAHSTGTMRSPEDDMWKAQYDDNNDRARIIKHANSICSDSTFSPTLRPCEVLVPKNWSNGQGLGRVRSDTDTYLKLPFQTVYHQ